MFSGTHGASEKAEPRGEDIMHISANSKELSDRYTSLSTTKFKVRKKTIFFEKFVDLEIGKHI